MEIMQDENRECEEKMRAYVQAGTHWLNRKDETAFRKLVLQNEEIAKKVFRESKQIGRRYILIYLNAEGRGADIAREEAAAWAYEYELKDCEQEEEEAFRSWLAGETDRMPEKMPAGRYAVGYPYRRENAALCYLSKVSTFTERLCVYGIKKRYAYIIREPVKEMLQGLGAEYVRSFFGRIMEIYQIPKADIMQLYSALSTGAAKTKQEKDFYRGRIGIWMERDREEYLGALDNMNKEVRKKVRVMLEREGMLNGRDLAEPIKKDLQ